MRNLEQYEKIFLASDFEKIMGEYRRKFLSSRLSLYKPRKVLEIGCGMHSIFESFRDLDRAFIVEPGELFIKHALALKEAQPRLETFHGTLEEFASQKISFDFDFVICSSLLHEIQDLEAFLVALLKVAKPGTLVHFNVPNANSVHRLLGQSMGLLKKSDEVSKLGIELQQNRVFSSKSLKEKLAQSGLKEVAAGSYFLKPFTHAQMSELVTSGFLTTPILNALLDISAQIHDLGAEIYYEGRKL